MARIHHHQQQQQHQVETVIVIAVHGLALLFVVHARIVAVERDVGPDLEGNWIYLHVLAGVVVEVGVAAKIAEVGNGALAHHHDAEMVEAAVVSSFLVVLLHPSSSYLEVHDGASSQAQRVSVHHVVDHLDGT